MAADKFTTKFQAALAAAQSRALGRDPQIVEPVPVLLALLAPVGGTGRPRRAQPARLSTAVQIRRTPRTRGSAGPPRLA